MDLCHLVRLLTDNASEADDKITELGKTGEVYEPLDGLLRAI